MAFAPERTYAIRVLMEDFLGLPAAIELEVRDEVSIQVRDRSGVELIVADVFFACAANAWCADASLPAMPLALWAVPDVLRSAALGRSRIEILYGSPIADGQYVRFRPDRVELGLDVFGSAFFMLSRYEEHVVRARDEHGRFSANSSVSERAGFTRHPIVNEYTEILWQCIRRLWPTAERKTRAYRLLLSHDVDVPFGGRNVPPLRVIRRLVGDVVQRRSPSTAVRRFTSWVAADDRHPESDWCYSFPFICDVSERHGLRSTFNFFGLDEPSPIDCSYRSTDAPIGRLLSTLACRGQEIGLHASYAAAETSGAIGAELQYLRDAALQAGVQQPEWGGRHHFLRWTGSATWSEWDDAGLAYDSSLGYAERPGFRCGTCYEFATFDIRARRSLRLRERPLVVMDVSLFSRRYLGLSRAHARREIVSLADEVRRYDGDFVLLWHNDTLMTIADRRFYESIVTALTSPSVSRDIPDERSDPSCGM